MEVVTQICSMYNMKTKGKTKEHFFKKHEDGKSINKTIISAKYKVAYLIANQANHTSLVKHS